MSLVIIETGGKQYRISEGDLLTIEKLPLPEGEVVEFDKVLLVSDDKGTQIGKPYIEGAKVKAEMIETGRGKKVSILKFKNKIRYRKLLGHRQPFSKVKITGLK